MTQVQYNQIHRREPGGDPERIWFSIFQILFPGTPRPSSPSVSTVHPVALAHFVVMFRSFRLEAMMEFMRVRREQAGGNFRLPLPTEALIDEAFEVSARGFLEHISSAWPRATDTVNQPPNPAVPPTLDENPLEDHDQISSLSNGHDSAEQRVAQTVSFTVNDTLSTSVPGYDLNSAMEGSYAQHWEQPANEPPHGGSPATYPQNYPEYWTPQFDFDPSAVGRGFDNYAAVTNLQFDLEGAVQLRMPDLCGLDATASAEKLLLAPPNGFLWPKQ
jgi:hypothetical protein